MTRLLAEHFRPDGKPKTAYPTQTEAQRAAHAYGKRWAYRCGFCGKFHIGGIAGQR